MEKLQNALQELICENAHILFDPNTNFIKIEEEGNSKNTQLRSVEIKGFEKIYFALKLDQEGYKFLQNDKLILDAKNIKKACDAIVFGEIKQKKYIFLVELKSETADHVAEKFKSTKAFLAYLHAILDSYYQTNLEDFTKISILFDRNIVKGKPVLLDKKGEKYYHEGFKRTDNETRIRLFI
ncbi:MAG: hypothetical protein EAZ97_16355 [Bacteroidetes bacterium]|nr:MAG: hypothetical protein EAZ97_16355 [Bacteroidota bacterium]